MLGTGQKLSLDKQNRTHFELHKPNKAIASSSMMRSMIILIFAVRWIWLVKRRMMQDNKKYILGGDGKVKIVIIYALGYFWLV